MPASLEPGASTSYQAFLGRITRKDAKFRSTHVYVVQTGFSHVACTFVLLMNLMCKLQQARAQSQSETKLSGSTLRQFEVSACVLLVRIVLHNYYTSIMLMIGSKAF